MRKDEAYNECLPSNGIPTCTFAKYAFYRAVIHGFASDSATLQCDECDKKFHLAAELKSHKIFRHSTERSESCDSCHRTFKTKGLLRRHKNTYHSTERKHMCDSEYIYL